MKRVRQGHRTDHNETVVPRIQISDGAILRACLIFPFPCFPQLTSPGLMRPLAILSFIATLLSGVLPTSSVHNLRPRGYITNVATDASYDYIIVGGGLAGLVLARRLSADTETTVLVLEAGDSGDLVADRINTPAGAFYSSLLYTSYDWQYKTVPQPQAGNRILDCPRGKILGGSSAVNAMYLIRPSEVEVNAWAGLMMEDDEDSAQAWEWETFYKYMKKSETYTPPSADLGVDFKWSSETYGTEGPMQASYPAFMVSQVGNWTPTWENLGLPALDKPNGGVTLGAFVSPSWINPSNLTRSYAKSAYLDPVLYLPNLSVLVNSTATRIIFRDGSGDLTATGVEFAVTENGSRQTVSAKKEVIIAAGVIGSPQILMLSGVGPKDVLEAVNIPVRVELPGVGQHLQDHLLASVVWNSTTETAGDIRNSGSDFSRTPQFLSFINDATAWVNLTRLFGSDQASSLRTSIANAMTSSSENLVPSQYSEVVEGYKAVYNVIANKILTSDVAVVELLLSTNSPGTVSVQAAIQHPFSQGRVYINSSSAFDPPVIDPNYLSHSADLTVLREGIKLVRMLGQTPPLNNSLGPEISPGAAVTTDDQLQSWLINGASTQYHPIGTCAMLPKSQSGVVNAQLRVYGTSNVRVVDSSVFPFEFGGHVGGSTYGLAEQASDLILRTSAASTLTNSFLDSRWLSIYFSILLAGHFVL